MFKKFLPVFVLLFSVTVQAQIGINNNGSAPDVSAILDITSTNKGVLLPRMLLSERNLIATPATGLLIWQTDFIPGLYYNAGTPAATNWQQLGQQGMAGYIGPPGPAGPTATSEYAHVYQLAGQSVPLGGAIAFGLNGLMTSGITHNPGSSFIFINVTGIYKIDFSVSATTASQIAVFQNGIAAAGSRYGSGVGSAQNTGSVIVSVTAGDVIQLTNSGSSAGLNLPANIGGSQSASNASVVIMKL